MGVGRKEVFIHQMVIAVRVVGRDVPLVGEEDVRSVPGDHCANSGDARVR